MLDLRILFDFVLSLFENIYNLIVSNWALSFSVFLSFVNIVVVTISIIFFNPRNRSEDK